MQKIKKSIIEFYITNVCNFNCDNCNRLNNYYFSGHDSWQDYKEVYLTWSQRVDFEKITILGGEPLLNPAVDQWVQGLRDLWPDAQIELLSNGSRIEYWNKRGFFDLISRTKTQFTITLHNRSRRGAMIDLIKSCLQEPQVTPLVNAGLSWSKAYDRVRDSSWPDCASYEDFEKLPDWIKKECIEVHKIGWDDWVYNTGDIKITDNQDKNINIQINFAENFTSAPLKYVGDNKFEVYNSNPDDAHRVCKSKDCTHMMKGKMYKCHHVALLPEFSQQYLVNTTQQDRDLLESYTPLTADANYDSMKDFVDNHLPNTIPQCKLCPSKLENIFLESSTNKPKVKKIYQLQHIDN
jgi:organic radical activating enzyme